MKLSRRQFLFGASGCAALGLLTGRSSSSVMEITETPQTVYATVPIPDLPKAFDGYQIGFLSDIHLSICSPTGRLEQALALLNAEHPDLVLLGGDFIWIPDSIVSQAALSLQARYPCFHHYRSVANTLYSTLAKHFKQIQCRDGIFGVLGNHDGWQAPQTCIDGLREGNVTILKNEWVEIARGNHKLTLIGFDDYWTGMPAIPDVSQGKTDNEVRLLLAHNPDYLSALLRRTKFSFDLGLAGHTHGGQIKLPALGPISYNVYDPLFGEGLVWFQRAHVYTTRGIGEVVVPVRVNCPPEVSILRLSRA